MNKLGEFVNIQVFNPKGGDVCPRCGEKRVPEGVFFESPEIKIPIRVKFFFFWINIEIIVSVRYCPRCGFLDVKLFKI